jgi:hypothetical protein
MRSAMDVFGIGIISLTGMMMNYRGRTVPPRSEPPSPSTFSIIDSNFGVPYAHVYISCVVLMLEKWLLVIIIGSSCLRGGGSIGAEQQLCWRPYAQHFRAPLLILRGGGDGEEDPSAGDAKRFMDSYTPAVYEKMRDDVARTSAYEHALRSLAPNMTVLDIGTGGLALLAISAAKAGARRVYAIEANANAYQQVGGIKICAQPS